MPTRWFAGIHITADCRRIEAAIVGIHGRGEGAPIERRNSMSFDLPSEIVDLFNELLDETGPRSFLIGPNSEKCFAKLANELVSVEKEALDELSAESRISLPDILAVGILDPGIWENFGNTRAYRPLTCPDLLAEQTGVNIIDSFPSRDIACNGLGGPLQLFPSWIILCSDEKDRLLLDLGRTARLTFLPRPRSPLAFERIEYADIVPCGGLFDELTFQLTRGQKNIDNGGHLTVQGKHLPDLLSMWKELEYSIPRQRWQPSGMSPAPYLRVVKERANAENWTLRDVLCTVSHFVAESIANVIESRFSKLDTDILLTGGGCRHGLLLNQLGRHLADWSMKPIREYGIPAESFDAVCVAILALLFVDQIPAGIQAVTGAESAKILGRITPGSLQNWNRLLTDMTSRAKF
ncbi:MAG: anhydro-N-acetylmuramic acid kinase [Thermoguttaceae bacterium]